MSTRTPNTSRPSPDAIFVAGTGKYVTVEHDGRGAKTYRTSAVPGGDVKFLDRLSDDAYLEVRSGSPRISADLLFFDQETNKVLVATRQQEPQPGDWVVGGRVPAGKSPAEAAELKAKEELSIDIDPQRLLPAGVYNLIWDSRAEGPLSVGDQTYTGVHDTAHLFVYPVTSTEIATMDLGDEYSKLRWVDPFEIIDAPRGEYHPAFVDMVSNALDSLTRPDLEHMSPDDRRLYHMGAIATIDAAARKSSER